MIGEGAHLVRAQSAQKVGTEEHMWLTQFRDHRRTPVSVRELWSATGRLSRDGREGFASNG